MCFNDKYTKEEIIALLAGIEGDSSHPPIVSFAEQQNIRPASFWFDWCDSGSGVEGKAGGHRYHWPQKAYASLIGYSKGSNLSLSRKRWCYWCCSFRDELNQQVKS